MSTTTTERPTGRMHELNREFGAKVREHLAASGMTLAELSRRTGMPYSTLSRKIHKGTRVTTVDVIVVANALGVDPGALLPSAGKSEEGAIIAASDTATVRLHTDPDAPTGAYTTIEDSAQGDLQGFDTPAAMRALADLLAAAADEWERTRRG